MGKKKEPEMKVIKETGVTTIEESFLDDTEPPKGESQELDEIIEEEARLNEEEALEEEEKIKVKRDMPRHSMEMCKCMFTPDELREMSDEMARKIGELDEKEAAKKAVAAQFKADIEAKQKEVNDLAQRVRNKFEYNTVKCFIDWNWKEKKVTYTRSDTGEIHRERAMTVDELQTELDIGE